MGNQTVDGPHWLP